MDPDQEKSDRESEEKKTDRAIEEVEAQRPAEDLDPKDPPETVLHPVTEVRNVALVILTTLAVLAVLRWASAFFIPMMLGFVFYYALAPVVEALVRLRIPRSVGAAALILGILWGAGALIYSLADDAKAVIEALPQAAERVGEAIQRRTGETTSPLESVQEAAKKLEEATAAADKPAPTPPAVQRVIVERPRFNVQDHLWTGTIGFVSLVGQIVIVAFLTYFLLLSGDIFRRKLVKIAGPTLTQKKLTVQALDEINVQIQRYLLVQLLASVLVGVSTAIAFSLLGLKHAAVWGVAAGVLNLVPYVGAILVTGGAGLVAFLQFGQVEPALYVLGVSLVINTLEGYLLVPLLTSKASRMNAVTVFVGVLVWGWLWGVWGLLLGIPIMMVIKAVCDRVEDFKGVGELMGT